HLLQLLSFLSRSTFTMANKTIREFSAPSAANVATGPAVIDANLNFELKPALITMVQASPFCGKTHEDANAHLQQFLEICGTFTIKGITQEAIRLRLFPFSLLEKAKQWFYTDRNAVDTWDKCSNAFLAKFFPMGKTNALRNKISSFTQQAEESIPEAWERLQEYVAACPHHGMEDWLLI
ncbi:retrotransposon gag domain-containing protein, partial [Haemophilus sp. SZY H51]